MKKRPMDRRSHDRYVGNIRTQLEIAKEVLLRLEMARDRRVLLDHEESLRKKVKLKSLGLSLHRQTRVSPVLAERKGRTHKVFSCFKSMRMAERTSSVP
jgi:hypothetical protein